MTADRREGMVGALFREEYPRLTRLAAVIAGDPNVAEELVADSFVQLWRHRRKVEQLDDPAAWLRRVVVNQSLSRRRRHLAYARVAEILRRRPTTASLDGYLPDPELWAEVERLPRRQRDVVLLIVAADLTIDECATVLGCGSETVRTHYRRARARLRDELGDEHDKD